MKKATKKVTTTKPPKKGFNFLRLNLQPGHSRITQNDSKILVKAYAESSHSWKHIMKNLRLQHLSRSYDEEQIRHHINYLKRKHKKAGCGGLLQFYFFP